MHKRFLLKVFFSVIISLFSLDGKAESGVVTFGDKNGEEFIIDGKAIQIRALLQPFGFIINPKSFKTNMYIDGVKQ